MEFRRAGQRDERRRRVLLDDALHPGDQEPGIAADAAEPRENRLYSEQAAAVRQRAITSFIPIKARTVAMLVAAGALAIVAVQAAHVYGTAVLQAAAPYGAAVVALQGPGTLAAWGLAAFFLIAAASSALIWNTRRYRLDDYRGRYQLWAWMVAVCILASIDAGTHGHRILAGLLANATGITFAGRVEVWTAIVLATLVCAVLLRLAWEVIACRAAVAGLVVCACGLLGGVVVHFHGLTGVTEQQRAIAESASTLGGWLAGGVSLLLYARFVFLQSQGLLPTAPAQAARAADQPPVSAEHTAAASKSAAQPAPRKTVETKRPAPAASPGVAKTETETSRQIRIDAAHPAGQHGADKTAPSPAIAAPAANSAPTAASAKVAQEAVEFEEADDSDGADGTDSTLSKSEQRRLKKQMKRQKRYG